MVLPRSLVLLSLSSLRPPCCHCSGVRRQSTLRVFVYSSVEVPPQGAVVERLRNEGTVSRLPPGAERNLASRRLATRLFVVVLLTADQFPRRPRWVGHAVLACPGFVVLLDDVPSSASASPPSPVFVTSAYWFVLSPRTSQLVVLLSSLRPLQWRGRSSSASATSFWWGLLRGRRRFGCVPLLPAVGLLLRRGVSFCVLRCRHGFRVGLLLGLPPRFRLRFLSL